MIARPAAGAAPVQPDRDCPLCPRLVAFRAENRAAFPAWHNAPVPSFGPLDARLLIVGLGPGLKGANRTGRPFTGDFAGDLLRLKDARISNSERCVPPQNKPLPAELKNCRPFLTAEIAAMEKLRVIVALGRVAHDAVLAALGLKLSRYTFGHAAMHALPDGRTLADSYHCSRYNTNTGVLTPQMFETVFEAARSRLET
jgi:uracil-DNA glycosylase family 4